MQDTRHTSLISITARVADILANAADRGDNRPAQTAVVIADETAACYFILSVTDSMK
jgi:hypothetical protein